MTKKEALDGTMCENNTIIRQKYANVKWHAPIQKEEANNGWSKAKSDVVKKGCPKKHLGKNSRIIQKEYENPKGHYFYT